MCMCVYTCRPTYAKALVKGEENHWDFVLSFQYVGSVTQTRASLASLYLSLPEPSILPALPALAVLETEPRVTHVLGKPVSLLAFLPFYYI